MPFTAQELANIANAALDYHLKGEVFKQTIQEKPLLDALMKSQKKFPGGKEYITVPVKGDYTTTIEGFSHDDAVSYQNPANLKRALYPWKELHAGISLTLTELKKDGISVVDSLNSESTSEHSERELTALTGILEDKLEDMTEGWARSMNEMLWLDGTQDSKEIPGVRSFILNDEDSGTTGGISRSVNSWWRNRQPTGASKITHSTTNQTLTKTLRAEVRQLRRYGGKPSMVLCGSDALERIEAEIHEKGVYTQEGFAKNIDLASPGITMRGVGKFMYDPTLDDLGLEEYIFMIDPSKLHLMVMDGEDRKQHTPARPYDRYVMYRAMTYTGGMVAKQLNCHGVYETA